MNELREIIKRNSHPLVLDKYVDALEREIREWCKKKVDGSYAIPRDDYEKGHRDCHDQTLKNIEEK